MAIYFSTMLYKLTKYQVFKAATGRKFTLNSDIKGVRILFPKGIKIFLFFACFPLFIFWDPVLVPLFIYSDKYFVRETPRIAFLFVVLQVWFSIILFAAYGICYGCDTFKKKIEKKVFKFKKIFALALILNFPLTLLFACSVIVYFTLKDNELFILLTAVSFPVITKILLRFTIALEKWAELDLYLYSSCLITIFSCFSYKLTFLYVDTLILGIGMVLVKACYKGIIYLIVPWVREWRFMKIEIDTEENEEPVDVLKRRNRVVPLALKGVVPKIKQKQTGITGIQESSIGKVQDLDDVSQISVFNQILKTPGAERFFRRRFGPRSEVSAFNKPNKLADNRLNQTSKFLRSRYQRSLRQMVVGNQFNRLQSEENLRLRNEIKKLKEMQSQKNLENEGIEMMEDDRKIQTLDLTLRDIPQQPRKDLEGKSKKKGILGRRMSERSKVQRLKFSDIFEQSGTRNQLQRDDLSQMSMTPISQREIRSLRLKEISEKEENNTEKKEENEGEKYVVFLKKNQPPPKGIISRAWWGLLKLFNDKFENRKEFPFKFIVNQICDISQSLGFFFSIFLLNIILPKFEIREIYSFSNKTILYFLIWGGAEIVFDFVYLIACLRAYKKYYFRGEGETLNGYFKIFMREFAFYFFVWSFISCFFGFVSFFYPKERALR